MLQVDLLPIPVQGRDAPPRIVEALQRADACGRYDALLLTRGGGSLEDLWAFNDESLARAITSLATPLVCRRPRIRQQHRRMVAAPRLHPAAAELRSDQSDLAQRLQQRLIRYSAASTRG